MSDLEAEVQNLSAFIGEIQDEQGSEGCYMELLRYARSAANVIQAHEYMFTDPARQIRGIRTALERLPQNQSAAIINSRTSRIRRLLQPTRKG